MLASSEEKKKVRPKWKSVVGRITDMASSKLSWNNGVQDNAVQLNPIMSTDEVDSSSDLAKSSRHGGSSNHKSFLNVGAHTTSRDNMKRKYY